MAADTQTEVAVAGGGIAGSAACVALARLGVRPLWIAPAPVADDRPGESLAPAANTFLKELGLARLLESPRHRRSNSLYSCWGSERLRERNAIVHLEGPGLVLDRPAFDAEVHAAAEPVSDRLDDRLEAAERDDGGWTIRTAGGESLRVGFILDCTGRAAVLARRHAARHRLDRLAAAVTFLDQQDDGIEPTPATLIEAGPDGWWYATLLPDRRLTVAYFSDPDLLPAGLSRDPGAWRTLIGETMYISQWIATAGYAAAAPPRLASAGTVWLEAAAGDGWAAVGDAAAAFDPLSSHGMTTALWSAHQAARAAVAWRNRDPEPLARYAEAVARGVYDFRRQQAQVYAQERRFADRPFWRRRHPGAAGFHPLGAGDSPR